MSENYYEVVTIYNDGVRKIERDGHDPWYEKKTRINQFIKPTSLSYLFIKWTHSQESVLSGFQNNSNVLLIRRKNVCKIKYNNDYIKYN